MQAVTGSAKTLSALLLRQAALARACLIAGFALPLAAAGQEAPARYVSPQDPVNEYLEAIETIEADYGPYATELSDMYLGLGQTLIGAGEYEQARDAFHRGVMVQRVNYGPNSPEQTNHLYVLANIESMLGEATAADKVLRNIYFINSKHYGEDSAEMLPVLKRMYQWYHVTRPLGGNDTDFTDHLRNVELTEEILRISELVNGDTDPGTATAYRRLGEANFQAVMFLTGMAVGVGEESYVSVRTDVLVPPELETISIYDYYNEGRRAFRNYRESLLLNTSTTPADYAQALADVGDWYLMIEKFSKSIDLYEEGYRVLAETEGYEHLAENYMKEPAPVHFVTEIPPAVADDVPEGFEGAELDVLMTVTTGGGLRQIEFPNAPEALSKRELKNIRNQLQKIPFRPAVRDGEVVTTREFNWRYRVAPKGEAS